MRFFPFLQWKLMLCHRTTNSRACGRFPQKKMQWGQTMHYSLVLQQNMWETSCTLPESSVIHRTLCGLFLQAPLPEECVWRIEYLQRQLVLHQVFLRHKAGGTQAGQGCFFGETHPKNAQSGGYLGGTLLFCFSFLVPPLCWWEGISGFDSVLNKCHVMRIVYIIS